MAKLYHNGQVEGWQIPGQQDSKARRVDVPSSPADLAAWLNVRRVGPTGAAAAHDRELEADPQLASAADGEQPWILGAATNDPPRVAPTFLGDLKSGAEFVPVTRAAAIAATYGACPKCQRTWTAQVLAGISTAELDDLKLIGEAIRKHVAELAEQLDGSSVQ